MLELKDQIAKHVHPIEICSPIQYMEELREKVSSAERRVWLQTMNFEADHFLGCLAHFLEKAAKRGVSVRFMADHFSKMVTDGNIDYIPTLSPQERKFRELRRITKAGLITELEANGVEVIITNKPKIFKARLMPGSGRNHIKMAIIDDNCYFGGINLSDKDINRAD